MDELELQTRESLEGKPITTNIFPFQVGCGCCLSKWVPEGQAPDLCGADAAQHLSCRWVSITDLLWQLVTTSDGL